MRKEHIIVVVVSVLATLLLLTPVAYSAYRAIPPRVATVDLQKLIEDEQRRTIEILSKSNGVVSEEQRNAIAKLTEDFAKKLSAAVDEVGETCQCVIVNKAALLSGNTVDYTDAVRERIKR